MKTEENNDLAYLSKDTLKQRIQYSKIFIGMFIVMFIVLMIGLIININKGRFEISYILPITFLPLFVINLKSLKKMQAELKRREE